MGLLLLLLCTFFAFFSLKLLIIAADHRTNKDQQPDYLSLSKECGGPFLALFTQICVLLSLLGSAVGRIIGFGQIMERLYDELVDPANADNESHIKHFYLYFVLGVSAIIILPLSLMRNMSSLRFTSLLSVSCSVFLTVVLLVQYFKLCEETCFWRSSFALNGGHLASLNAKDVFLSIPFFIYGFNCHPSVFPIYKELERDSSIEIRKKAMQRVVASGVSIGISSDIVAASSGFLRVLDLCKDNILINDFEGAPELILVQVLFTLAMILAVPIFINVMRQNVINMIWSKNHFELWWL